MTDHEDLRYANVKGHYERGFRAGVEAAAKEAERHGYMCRLVVVEAIRALAAPPPEGDNPWLRGLPSPLEGDRGECGGTGIIAARSVGVRACPCGGRGTKA